MINLKSYSVDEKIKLIMDLKIKLTKEYIINGCIKNISDVGIIKDLLDLKKDITGNVILDSLSPRVNCFMEYILDSHTRPPLFNPKLISEYASLYQKSNFFEQYQIDNVDDFNSLYDEYRERNDVLYRGQNEAKWRLYNKLQREWLTDERFLQNVLYEDFVNMLVDDGRDLYLNEIKNLLNSKHIDVGNSISILSFLQHNSCPTPLLDWTSQFQIALFFAIDGLIYKPRGIEIEDYFSVYFIEEQYLDSGSMKSIIEEGLLSIGDSLLSDEIQKLSNGDELKKYILEEHFAGRTFFDNKLITGSGHISHMTKINHLFKYPILYFRDKCDNSNILFLINNNANIINQKGAFVWSSEPSKPLEMVGKEEYYKEKSEEGLLDYKFCKCFNINKNLLKHVSERLKSDGIINEFIYPNSEICSRDVFEKCKQTILNK